MTGEDTAQDLSSQENTVKPQYSDPALIPTSSSRADDQKVTSDDSAGGTISKQSADKTKFLEESVQSLSQTASDTISKLRSLLPSRTTTAKLAAGGAFVLCNFLWNEYAFERSSTKFETEYLRKAAEQAEHALSLADVEDSCTFNHWFGA
ncbi:MAG: hypothetical protein TREMPRED_005337, partial [Tremellales sp. Tagirdzhanova-0007]